MSTAYGGGVPLAERLQTLQDEGIPHHRLSPIIGVHHDLHGELHAAPSPR